MKAYKVFYPDWTGYNKFKWEIGKTYEYSDDMKMGAGGFYFCMTLTECLKWRGRGNGNHVTEIDVTGSVIGEDTSVKGTRYITDELMIVRELSDEEIDNILAKEKAMGI